MQDVPDRPNLLTELVTDGDRRHRQARKKLAEKVTIGDLLHLDELKHQKSQTL